MEKSRYLEKAESLKETAVRYPISGGLDRKNDVVTRLGVFASYTTPEMKRLLFYSMDGFNSVVSTP